MRLIDADNLDETITRLNEQDWGITRNEYKLIDRVIFEMPTVNVQKSGKWIIQEDNTSYVKTIPRRWAECSCCKWSMSPGYVDRYAFCPNCGAKMESEK